MKCWTYEHRHLWDNCIRIRDQGRDGEGDDDDDDDDSADGNGQRDLADVSGYAQCIVDMVNHLQSTGDGRVTMLQLFDAARGVGKLGKEFDAQLTLKLCKEDVESIVLAMILQGAVRRGRHRRPRISSRGRLG